MTAEGAGSDRPQHWAQEPDQFLLAARPQSHGSSQTPTFSSGARRMPVPVLCLLSALQRG